MREQREKGKRNKEATGILDHEQESPHWFLGVSYLTSATYIFNHRSVRSLTLHLVRSSDRNRSGDPCDEDLRSPVVVVVTCRGG